MSFIPIDSYQDQINQALLLDPLLPLPEDIFSFLYNTLLRILSIRTNIDTGAARNVLTTLTECINTTPLWRRSLSRHEDDHFLVLIVIFLVRGVLEILGGANSLEIDYFHSLIVVRHKVADGG